MAGIDRQGQTGRHRHLETQTCRQIGRQRQTRADRKTQTFRDTDIQTRADRKTQTFRDTDMQTDRQTETDKSRQKDTNIQRHRHADR